MALGDWINQRGCVVCALVEPCVEDLKWLVGIERLPEAGVVFRELRHQDSCVVAIKVSDAANCGDGEVSWEGVIEGGEVSVFKYPHELIKEGGVHLYAFIVLMTGFLVLPNDAPFIDLGPPQRYGGHLTGVGKADEGDWYDTGILGHHQYKT